MQIQKISPETKKVLTLASEKHYGFRVMEAAGVLSRETYKDGWWLIPTDDSTQISAAGKRIKEIKNRGITIRQVIVAHEAPRLLCAPKVEKKPFQLPRIDWEGIEEVGKVVGTILGVFTAVGTALLAGTGLLLVVGLAALVDPAVIVVLEDGTWVEVMRWYE